MIVVRVFELHSSYVWLDLADVEEHIVDFVIVVRVGAAKIVTFSYRLFHLEAIEDGKCNIVHKDRLYIGVHALDLPKHAIEHFHVHAPLGSNSRVRIQVLHDVSRAQDRHIGVNGLHFLLTDPLGA